MKFYNREKELIEINRIIKTQSSQLVYFLGRRRIGKTSLINHYFEKNKINYLYFFVGNKGEGNLLEAFSETLNEYLGYNTKFSSIREFLKFLFEFSIKNKGTYIVFDEFQNFKYVNEDIYSDFQEYWDKYKDKGEIKIFAIGSIYTLMEEVFQDKGSPLFGRATAKLYIDEFELNVLRTILQEYNIYSKTNLLDIYTIFGGVPKYLEILDQISVKEEILSETVLGNILKNYYICENSLFLKEGTDLLLSEFGKSQNIYFSILEAIANSKTKRSEIADYTKINYDSLGLYLDNLEKKYKYIEKLKPIVDQKNILNKYKIKDNFLFFRFRYIYKKSNLIEIGKYDKLINFILEDINVIKGFILEKLVKQLIINQNKENRYIIDFEKIGNYWDKAGNEIDLLCYNETTKQVVFIECKLNKYKITQGIKDKLISKSESISKFKGYTKQYQFISLDDIDELF